MLNKINPTKTSTWKALEDHYTVMQNVHMSDLFSSDPDRFLNFSIKFEDILLDYSKNIINDETIKLLLALAREVKLTDAIDNFFSGEKINETENRAVLHTALRNRSNTPVHVNGTDVMPEINAVLNHIKLFSEKIISGKWKGYTGKPITDIVNIGIGGADRAELAAGFCQQLLPQHRSEFRGCRFHERRLPGGQTPGRFGAHQDCLRGRDVQQ